MQATPDIDYKDRYEQSQQQITMLRHEIDQLKKLIYGSRNERFVAPAPNQLALGIQTEVAATCSVVEAKQIAYTRTKVAVEKKPLIHPGRGKLPEHLRREDITIEPVNLPEGSRKIGEVITEQLECIAAELYVKRYIRPKYVSADQPNEDQTTIIIADMPAQPLEKSIAGPGLLAQIIIDKFMDHLPVYRQVQRFERAGIKLPYSTIIDWIGASCKLVDVLYEALKKELLSSNYLHADETTIKVLDQDKAGKKVHNGFFWVYNNSLLKLVFFDYQQSRKKEAPKGILTDFKGHLQTDGYEGYEQFERREHITHFLCMAHARRYFVEAQETDAERSAHVLEQMQQLYAIERRCREQELSFDERKEIRQKESVPILNNLEAWMKEQLTQKKVLPGSPIGKAIAYSIKRWDKLCRYTENGMLSIDNNPVENSIRPVALGRKNYLFCGSHEAAQRTAMIYSLLGSCKMQGLDPYLWLKDVLSRISTHPINKIKELLPNNWKPLQVQDDKTTNNM